MQQFEVQTPHKQQLISQSQQFIKSAPKSTGIGLIACLFYLPFMIADLALGFSNNYLCTTIVVPSVSFTLGTWLIVDGFCRLTMLLLSIFLLVFIICCIQNSPGTVVGIGGCYFLFNILYNLFTFSWLVVGAVMFWGYITNQRSCETSIQVYMYILLIVNFLGIFFNVFCSRGKSK